MDERLVLSCSAMAVTSIMSKTEYFIEVIGCYAGKPVGGQIQIGQQR